MSGKIYMKKENVMNFTKKELQAAIENLAKKGKIFSNESQFQLDLAWELKKRGFHVELEVLSVTQSAAKNLSKDERKKAYTDVIVKDEDGYIAIELKYKTPQTDDIMYYDMNGVTTYLFSQGAENIGSYLYWKDVERLEKLVDGTIPLNYDKDKKVIRGYAVLLTNSKKYWDKGKYKNFATNMAHEFYPYQDKKVHNQKLSYNIALNCAGTRIKGFKKAVSYVRVDTPQKSDIYFSVKEAKNHYPIELKGDYTCIWDSYLSGLTCNLLNGKVESEGDEFKYLILEINMSQGQTP